MGFPLQNRGSPIRRTGCAHGFSGAGWVDPHDQHDSQRYSPLPSNPPPYVVPCESRLGSSLRRPAFSAAFFQRSRAASSLGLYGVDGALARFSPRYTTVASLSLFLGELSARAPDTRAAGGAVEGEPPG